MSIGNADERRRRLAQVIRMKPDDAACLACLNQLDAYIAAQLGGEDYAARFPDVARHLDGCVECAQAYARLYELERAAMAETLPQPAHLPRPDLGFLQPQSPSLAERLRAALRRAGDRFTLRLSDDLLAGLRPAPAIALTRAPADAERYAEVLLVLRPDESLRSELPFGLTAYRDARRPDECLLEVSVELPGRSWPDLGGLTVALVLGTQKREAVTDAWGLAAFEGVPVAALGEASVEVELR